MASFPWVRFTGVTAGLVSVGYLLMKATTPTEEQLYKEMSPDIRRKVDAARATRLEREKNETETVSSSTPRGPVWSGAPPPPHSSK